MRHPHFDEDRLIWSDAYSGVYAPPSSGYSEQFDLQWHLALKGESGYYDNAGASVDDEFIADRVYEWTGRWTTTLSSRTTPRAGLRVLDHPIDPALIEGKACVDAGCGMGRWTRTMIALGAGSVLSIDMSESGLRSVARFNPRTLTADITRLGMDHPELRSGFDFATLWGVAHHTHDPALAFRNVADVVRPGGSLYLMVYAPEGMHGTGTVNRQRRHFHRLRTVEARLEYVDRIYERRWDWRIPLRDNVKNVARNALRWPRWTKVGILDMLEPFYNWVIPLDVIHAWFERSGFERPVVVNELEPGKCAYHVVGRKRG